MLRTSARSRRRVAAATPDAKLAGSLHPLASSTIGKHVGGTPPEEKSTHQRGCKRDADAREFLSRNGRGNLLAVDQHAVAVEYDHDSPRQRSAALTSIQTHRITE